VALLEVRGLTVRFGGHTAVTDVDLDVERGCVTGLIGPNGAGKTTIFNAITGLQQATSGTITLNHRDITRARPRERARLGIARSSTSKPSGHSPHARTSSSRPRSAGGGPMISTPTRPTTPKRFSTESGYGTSRSNGPTSFQQV
jgi:energy-coupling factor transporter ATP-binding protein EcfA2